jgi:hypothetical protein
MIQSQGCEAHKNNSSEFEMKSLIDKATEIRYTTSKAGDVLGQFMSN